MNLEITYFLHQRLNHVVEFVRKEIFGPQTVKETEISMVPLLIGCAVLVAAIVFSQ